MEGLIQKCRKNRGWECRVTAPTSTEKWRRSSAARSLVSSFIMLGDAIVFEDEVPWTAET